MTLLGLMSLMILYVKRKGIDFFLLAAGTCVIYFYPILFLNRVVFISEGIHSVDVYDGARISLIVGIVFLLCVGLKSKNVNEGLSSQRGLKTSGNFRQLAIFVALLVVGLMGIIVAKNGVGLGGRDKSQVMENLGYIYKVYILLTSILVSFAFVLKERKLLVVALAAVSLDLLFGFRSGIATLIAAYFLTRSGLRGWRSVLYLFLGIGGAISMVVAKETAYFSKDMVEVALGFITSFDTEGVDFLSMVNPESATISAVYNEIVKSDFSVSAVYIFDGFVSLLPFTNLAGYEAVGFASYFKGVVFGAEGDSFASGMLSVGYGAGGYFGVGVCFVVIAWLGKIFERVAANGRPLEKVLIVAVASIVITTFYRSDLIYLIGIIRSLIFIYILLRIIGGMMSVLAKKTDSSSNSESLSS